MTRPASLCAGVVAALVLGACGGLQPVDPGQALRDSGAALAKLKTVHASLTFTKGTVSFQGYQLVSASASVRAPSESDTIYKVRQKDVQISFEIVITGGHVYLHPPFSGYTELKGDDAATVPDLAKLFDSASGLPAVIPQGQQPKYLGTEKLGDIDCHIVGATYAAAQIKGMMAQLSSAQDVDAKVWIGGDDHLIRKAILTGNFGDNGTPSSVQVDLSAFNAAAAIATPKVSP